MREVGPTVALLAIALAATTVPVYAQASSRGPASWELWAAFRAVRLDDDFARGRDGTWSPVASGSVAWRPSPQASLGIEAWRTPADGAPVWGVVFQLVAVPWAGRWAVDPALLFGVETIRADDEEERSLAFLGGLGARLPLGSRWTLETSLRNHFLTIEEERVDGVETGRDASLWEVGVGLGIRIAGP